MQIIFNDQVRLELESRTGGAGGAPLHIEIRAERVRNSPGQWLLLNVCDDVDVAVVDAAGQVVSSARVVLSVFHATRWGKEYPCSGTGRITLPASFDATQLVTFQVSKPRSGEVLGISTPLPLVTSTPAGSPLPPDQDPIYTPGPGFWGGVWNPIGSIGSGIQTGLETTANTLKWVSIAALVGVGMYATWPVIEQQRRRLS